jgi:hypothetical protein
MSREVRPAPAYNRKGGGHACSVCNHPEREAIDIALLTPKRAQNEPQLTILSTRYGLGIAALSRHRTNHIVIKGHAIVRPSLPADASQLQHLEAQAARLETSIAQAEKAGRFEQIVTGSRELRITREAIAKAKGEQNGHAAVVVDLQRSKEWLAIRAVLWEVLEPYDKLRAEIGRRLLALDVKATK